MEEITKAEIEAYEKVRCSGKYNMVTDASRAMLDMKLNPRHKTDMDKYFKILMNYSELMKKFNVKRG